jgi:hypothetical protein
MAVIVPYLHDKDGLRDTDAIVPSGRQPRHRRINWEPSQ